MLDKNEKECKKKRLLLIWILPVSYMLMHALKFHSANILQYSAQNIIPIIAGLIIILSIETDWQLKILLIGLSLFFLIDGILGIGQYFDLEIANKITEKISASVQIVQSERICGMQLYAHIFAYHQGIWTLMVWWIFLDLDKNSIVKYYFLILFVIGLVAVFLSGQRSVVWPIVPIIIIMYILLKGFNKRSAIDITIASLILISVLTYFLKNSDGTAARILSFRVNYSDFLRFLTWEHAVTILYEDPLWGSVYLPDEDLPIHNGLLNGWVRFGIIWLILFIVAIRQTINDLWKYHSSVRDRLAGLSIISLIIFNSMFHTNTPGKNDMAFYIFLSLIAAMLSKQKKVNS